MANLAAIDNLVLHHVDLMAQDCVIEVLFVLLDQILDALFRQQADVVL